MAGTAIYPDLNGKLVLVTGGAGGIGSACCRLFAANGSRVVVAGHSELKAARLVNQLPGHNHMAVGVNVQTSSSVDEMADRILQKYGQPPEILVHSAAIMRNSGGLLQCSEADYDETMAVNVKGTFLINKKFVGLMVDNNIKGAVVNVASIAANGLATAPEYSCSKGGVFGISKAIAKEMAPHNIRVVVLAPGAVGDVMGSTEEAKAGVCAVVNVASIAANGLATAPEYSCSKGGVFGISKAIAKEMAPHNIRVVVLAPGAVGDVMGSTEEAKAGMVAMIPMKRIATYEECANVCVFLASDQASYITCSVYCMHGGLIF